MLIPDGFFVGCSTLRLVKKPIQIRELVISLAFADQLFFTPTPTDSIRRVRSTSCEPPHQGGLLSGTNFTCLQASVQMMAGAPRPM